MKNLFLFIVVLLLANCTTENALPPNNNLITNSSFEDSNGFNFQNWTGNISSSSTDTPNNGGNYSLQLEPGWAPDEGFAETAVTNLNGPVSLRFSCDAKVIDWIGRIIILKEDSNGNRTELSNITFNNAVWQNVSFDINTNLINTDSIIIHLSADITEIATGKVLFDNVSLIEY